MKPDFAALFDAVLRDVEQGADPFAAARAEGVPFVDLYAWCRDQVAPGYHPYSLLLEARAEWLSGAYRRAVERMADDIVHKRIRSKALAANMREVIEAIAAEAQHMRRLAGDMRTFGAVAKEVIAAQVPPMRSRKQATEKTPPPPTGPYVGVSGPITFPL